ncbi:MAG: hypothetical protein ACREJO_14860, partial [Phycisphaerales bacterium]
MAQSSSRRNLLITALIIIVVIILLLLTRCLPEKTPVPPKPSGSTPPAPTAPAQPQTNNEPAPKAPEEILTPATVTAPQTIPAGSIFSAAWTGPDNGGDYLIIVRPDAPPTASGSYKETKHGKSVDLTAPMETGAYEVRYVTARSRKILGRMTVEVTPVAAALDAAAEVTLGAPFPVTWTGPKNTGDYITIVPKDAPDAQYGNYTDVNKGSPLTLTAPTLTGDAELRYVSGQGKMVLARRPIKVIAAD